MDRIVYLDIDGVLNRYDYAPTGQSPTFSMRDRRFNPDCVDELKAIMRIAKAKVRVISAWRYHLTPTQIHERFLKYGIGVELVEPSPERAKANEIARDILANEFKNYVVIDDDPGNELDVFWGKLIKTDPTVGIDGKVTRAVCERLCDYGR